MGRVRRGFGRFGLAPRTREASSFMRLACQFAIAFCLSFPATGMTTERQEPAEPAPSSAQAQTPPAAKENAPVEQVPPDAPPDSANSQTPSGGEKTGEAAKKQTNSASTTATRKRHKHPAPAADGTPRKVVVREGGASEPAAQIAPDITPAEAARQRQNAEQLLGSTDEQLKRLAGRTFDAGRQETVGQIRNYMDDARSALKEGDVGRANTLAQKARLLADDLVKH